MQGVVVREAGSKLTYPSYQGASPSKSPAAASRNSHHYSSSSSDTGVIDSPIMSRRSSSSGVGGSSQSKVPRAARPTPSAAAAAAPPHQEAPAEKEAGIMGVHQPLPDRVLVYARCRPELSTAGSSEQQAAHPDNGNTVSPAAPGNICSPAQQQQASPLLSRDPSGKHSSVAISPQPEDKKVTMASLDGSALRDNRSFTFDGVFDGSSTQADVYRAVARPVLREVLCGYHGCIMAYGQTGTGKTYSLLNPGSGGDLSQAGLVPRLAADLFTQTTGDGMAKYEVNIGMFQIYNEQVDDLLCAENQGLKIKQEQTRNPSAPTSWYVEGLSWRPVATAGKLLEHLAAARKRLVYAETKMNKHSSRSHCVVLIKVIRQEVPTSMLTADGKVEAQGANTVKVRQTEGQLTIVDLAGSERIKKSAAQDMRLKEAININTSLLMLGNVIQGLAARQSHIPFRDSALTRMLEASLSGNSRCAMLVCLAPEPSHLSESLSTLDFASRAMRVQTRPVLHESTVELDPEELASQLASQFESDAAMRSQVELAQLKRAFELEAKGHEEAKRQSRSSAARAEELMAMLEEEAAGRARAVAEAAELRRRLGASEAALKRAQGERDGARRELADAGAALVAAKAAAEASSASTAAVRDVANVAKEASRAAKERLEQEAARRVAAEEALGAMREEEEAARLRAVEAGAQTDPLESESDEDEAAEAPSDWRESSSGVRRSLPSRPAGYQDPLHKSRERKAELQELQARLREKDTLVASLRAQLTAASSTETTLHTTQKTLEERLAKEEVLVQTIQVETARRVEKISEEWSAAILKMGVVCTKRGRNNKEYTRVLRLAEDMETLEWAAVKDFRHSMEVRAVEQAGQGEQRPATTVHGPSRSTSIIPQGRIQEMWVEALSRHFDNGNAAAIKSPVGASTAAVMTDTRRASNLRHGGAPGSS